GVQALDALPAIAEADLLEELLLGKDRDRDAVLLERARCLELARQAPIALERPAPATDDEHGRAPRHRRGDLTAVRRDQLGRLGARHRRETAGERNTLALQWFFQGSARLAS